MNWKSNSILEGLFYKIVPPYLETILQDQNTQAISMEALFLKKKKNK